MRLKVSKEGFNLFNFARNVQLPEIIPAFEKFSKFISQLIFSSNYVVEDLYCIVSRK